MGAPFAIKGPVNCRAFESSIKCVLKPELRSGDVVVTGNVFSHRGVRICALIAQMSVRLRPTAPDSPDFNPVENAFAAL